MVLQTQVESFCRKLEGDRADEQNEKPVIMISLSKSHLLGQSFSTGAVLSPGDLAGDRFGCHSSAREGVFWNVIRKGKG